MADVTEEKKTPRTAIPCYTKEQLVKSQKYRPYKDVLAVVLETNRMYTHKECQEEIQKFLDNPVA